MVSNEEYVLLLLDPLPVVVVDPAKDPLLPIDPMNDRLLVSSTSPAIGYISYSDSRIRYSLNCVLQQRGITRTRSSLSHFRHRILCGGARPWTKQQVTVRH
jgi:hypothetical protein